MMINNTAIQVAAQHFSIARMGRLVAWRRLTGHTNLAQVRSASSGLWQHSNNPYRPIYSTSDRFKLFERHQLYQLQTCTTTTSRRYLANTTSGTGFAPSSVMMAEANRQKQAVHHDHDDHHAPSSSTASSISSVFEDSDHLPSLPVPSLNKTMELLKETIWPIAMNSNEFANALHLIEAFSGSAGQKLDLLLRTKASQTKNWMTHDWWIEEAYLKSRSPLVINSNPAMIYPQFPFAVNNQDQLVATVANLVSGIIDYKLALQRGYNPEAIIADQVGRLNPNLCYDQYKRIFGFTRLPGKHMDTVRPPANLLDGQQFNLVCAHRGRFFEINLNNIDNEQGRISALTNVLGQIIDNCRHQDSSGDDCGLGILTSTSRDTWAQSIELIDPNSLEAIQNADIMLSLDTIPSEPLDSFVKPLLTHPPNSPQHLEALSKQVLHGDRTNVGNRWFDKSLQLIVVADEACERLIGAGVNYEHSVAEAVVVTKMIEYSYDKTVAGMNSSSGNNGRMTADKMATYKQLSMKQQNGAEQQLKTQINQAKLDFVSRIDLFDLAYFDYSRYGRDAIKSWRFSPDSWFQVALQLAHYQLHKRLGPCYESASTRSFAYGRTETIRSLTKDVAQFCHEPNWENMLAAIQSHKAYAHAASNAAAIDRVLLGYKMIFNELKANRWSWGVPTFECGGMSKNQNIVGENGHDETNTALIKFHSLADMQHKQQVDINDLFTEKELGILGAFFHNELFERSKRFVLSTSQVSSPKHPDICMSYGPLVADGYGCCYNLSGQKIVGAITANSSNQSFSCEVDKLSESLRDSLDKMKSLVEERQELHQQQQRHHEQHQRF